MRCSHFLTSTVSHNSRILFCMCVCVHVSHQTCASCVIAQRFKTSARWQIPSHHFSFPACLPSFTAHITVHQQLSHLTYFFHFSSLLSAVKTFGRPESGRKVYEIERVLHSQEILISHQRCSADVHLLMAAQWLQHRGYRSPTEPALTLIPTHTLCPLCCLKPCTNRYGWFESLSWVQQVYRLQFHSCHRRMKWDRAGIDAREEKEIGGGGVD